MPQYPNSKNVKFRDSNENELDNASSTDKISFIEVEVDTISRIEILERDNIILMRDNIILMSNMTRRNAMISKRVLIEQGRDKYRAKYIVEYKSNGEKFVYQKEDIDREGNPLYEYYPKNWTYFIEFVERREKNKGFLSLLYGGNNDYGMLSYDIHNRSQEEIVSDLEFLKEDNCWLLFADLSDN
mmetsp:Transcript_10539/g.9456  ORF Transcript_10539/g.9456 Transcript_10539/m.9456 type:complete len:185 (+) Transcript_10539:168-722(+)